MTLNELERTMPAKELEMWIAFYTFEAEETERANRKANRKR